MGAVEFREFHVRLSKDHETGQVVAEAPSLGIADYGSDHRKSLGRLRTMVSFHLECLVNEGKPIPKEKRQGESVYLRVKIPVRAS